MAEPGQFFNQIENDSLCSTVKLGWTAFVQRSDLCDPHEDHIPLRQLPSSKDKRGRRSDYPGCDSTPSQHGSPALTVGRPALSSTARIRPAEYGECGSACSSFPT